LSDPDDFDRMFEEMIAMTQKLLNGTLANAGQPGKVQPAGADRDEILEGKDFVTFLLDSPGRVKEDFQVDVTEEQLSVKAHGIDLRRRLPCRVDPASVVVSYNNGILDVRVNKKN